MSKVSETRGVVYGPQEGGGYRCRLGWVFSAEDCRYEEKICKETEEWFNRHFRQHMPSPLVNPQNKGEDEEALTREEARSFLGWPSLKISEAIKAGSLPFHKKEGSSRHYFRKKDLEALIAEEKRE